MAHSSPLTRVPVEFIGSFPDATVRLTPALPEIALLGRSNVGKSSLLNALFGRKLARTSTTPGRTALLNVYRLPGLYLLDLPGYGYARASQAERTRYARLVRGVLEKRNSLTGALWLLDLRHDPSAEDLAFGERLAARKLPVLAVLTKADKLPHGRRLRRAAALADGLGLAPDQVHLTSSTTGLGIDELGETLLQGSKEA
jgi:GTP-binding protein